MPQDDEKVETVKLLNKAYKILGKEPNLLSIEASNVIIVGDLHGDYDTLQRVLQLEWDKIIFLGDYVDRGPRQIDTITTVLKLKAENPDHVIMLRGNHEDPGQNYYGGFTAEVVRRFGLEIYNLYVRVYSQLPLACILNGDIFLVHGGIPQNLRSIDEIGMIKKGIFSVEAYKGERSEILLQLLWNDPREGLSGFKPNIRGPGTYYFGMDVFEDFQSKNGFKYMIRAHEVQVEGYKWFFKNRLLSLFTSNVYPFPVNPAVARVSDSEVKVIHV